jgi:hypothetical protein
LGHLPQFDDDAPVRPSHAARRAAGSKRASNQWLTIGVTAIGIAAVIGTAWLFFGPAKERAKDRHEKVAGEETAEQRPKKKRKLVANARPQAGTAATEPISVVSCEIYTPEPGFFVLVDGEPARNDQGTKLTTPCAVGLPAGNHTLTVVREKFRDHSEEVLIAQERTFDLAPVYEPFAASTGFFASPLATAAAGEPVELKSLNAGGPSWDPFIAADGLSLWFAGQKEEGKGVFVARRKNLIEDFGKPELLGKMSDRPASPSVTETQLVVAYAVHGRAQIRSLARKETDAPFKQGPVLAFSERDGEHWPSAQISPDGQTLYYVQERKGKTTAHVATRTARQKSFDDDPAVISLPGTHPRMSADGLRQYWFDGEKLWRATRENAAAEFSKPAPLCPLELANYTAHPGYRQFCVSEDEQWVYYSDAPEETGKLYAVRFAEGPRRGFAPRGKSIPQKEIAQTTPGKGEADHPQPEPEKTNKPEEEPVVVDPRTAPLPYDDFRGRLEMLLAVYDFEAAAKLIDEALRDPRFEKDKAVLEWDREEIQRLVKFQERLDAAIAALKPGDVVRAGAIQIEFAKYEERTFSGKVRGSEKTASRTIVELTPADLVALVDKRADRNDAPAQLEIGTFLAQFSKVSPQVVSSRLDRAGDKGKEVLERQLLRKLHLVEEEIARDNFGAGLQLLDKTIAAAPKLKAAARARELRDSLPARLTWTPVGPQTWNTAPPGEFAAASRKAPGAYLVSAAEYGNFVLTLEWKTDSDAAQGGVYFRFKRGGDLRKNAFKIHFAGDHAIRATPDRFSTGSLFGIKGPKSNTVRPTGEWNTLALRVEKDRIRATVNGVEVLDTPATDPNIGPQGCVCLDGEFGGITYRKVLVYELPPRAPATKK